MFKTELNKSQYYDFVLTDDVRSLDRNPNDYMLFHIDVTKNLTSVSGLTQTENVTLENIALTGYDNGLLNNNILRDVYGEVKVNNPYSYTFTNINNFHLNYVANFDSPLFYNQNEPLLFEAQLPISKYPQDTNCIYITDNTTFGFFVSSTYVDGVLGEFISNGSISAYTGMTNQGDMFSFYLDANIIYLQQNGVTFQTYNLATGTTYGIALAFGTFFAATGTTYTFNDVRLYHQSPNFGDMTYQTSYPINSTYPYPTTGITYDVSKTKFKLYPVTGMSGNIKYDILSYPDHNQLEGGFYQGFFKLYDYPVEYLPSRMRKGWTVNMMLHFPINDSYTGVTLNKLYPDNSGFIYYIGTRAENKFKDLTPEIVSGLTQNYNFNFSDYPSPYPIKINPTGVTFYEYMGNEYIDYLVPGSGLTGQTPNYTNINGAMVPISNILYTTFNYKGDFSVTSGVTYTGRSLALNGQPYTGYFQVISGVTYTLEGDLLTYYDKYVDLIDNSFGIRITPDGRIGYRTIYATDPCYTGVTQNPTGISNNSFIDYTRDCDNFTVRKIITKYFTIEESYSKAQIIGDFNAISTQFYQLILTELGDNLFYEYSGDTKNLFITVTYERDFSYDNECELEYFKYKNGTLTINVNGINVYRNHNVSEVIPHKLDTDKRLQEGVPFNLSFGGGTQGLHDQIGLSSNNNSIIEKFFGGSFDGGVNFIEMYSVPLYITEIRDIIKNKLSSYNLYYPKGGRRIFIKNMM